MKRILSILTVVLYAASITSCASIPKDDTFNGIALDGPQADSRLTKADFGPEREGSKRPMPPLVRDWLGIITSAVMLILMIVLVVDNWDDDPPPAPRLHSSSLR